MRKTAYSREILRNRVKYALQPILVSKVTLLRVIVWSYRMQTTKTWLDVSFLHTLESGENKYVDISTKS